MKRTGELQTCGTSGDGIRAPGYGLALDPALTRVRGPASPTAGSALAGYRAASQRVVDKVIDRLDEHCHASLGSLPAGGPVGLPPVHAGAAHHCRDATVPQDENKMRADLALEL